jgi:hypothetical protein
MERLNNRALMRTVGTKRKETLVRWTDSIMRSFIMCTLLQALKGLADHLGWDRLGIFGA